MKKYIIFFLILLLTTLITLFSIISDNTIVIFKELIKNIKFEYIFIILIIIFMYFILQGIYMKVIFKSLNTKISVLKGTFYAMIEFYFSGITPSSSGGQPAQLYFMTKDKIPPTKSIITLILNTIYTIFCKDVDSLSMYEFDSKAEKVSALKNMREIVLEIKKYGNIPTATYIDEFIPETHKKRVRVTSRS